MNQEQQPTQGNGSGKYSARNYAFSKEFLNEAFTLHSHQTFRALFMIWLAIFLLIFSMKWLLPTSYFGWIYFPVAFLIAGRQGALLQIVHEGAHTLIHKNKVWNDWIANWFAAYPVGLTVEGYAKGHLQHHAYTNTSGDLPTDLEKYSAVDFKSPRLTMAFLRDLLGITAIGSFLGHSQNSVKGKSDTAAADNQTSTAFFPPAKIKKLKDRMGQGIVQLGLLILVFQFDVKMYLLLWLIPMVSFNMVLLRIRGIAEHGLPRQVGKEILSADQGNLYTRSMLLENDSKVDQAINFVEKMLIGSLNCNFHHEHHILPKVPFYKLPTIHRHIHDEIKRSHPFVYAKSYRHAFLMGRRSQDPQDTGGTHEG